MKGILIKREDGYNLASEQPQGRLLEATCSPSQETALFKSGVSAKKLSLKNCQAIENGYDLDELADESVYDIHKVQNDFIFKEIYKAFFKDGFQKAIELMEGKKFSEEDVRKAYYVGKISNIIGNEALNTFIQSLQPKEWEVEIEMICPHPEDTYTCGMQYGCDEDGCNHPNQIPYLDKNGCLILRKYDK